MSDVLSEARQLWAQGRGAAAIESARRRVAAVPADGLAWALLVGMLRSSADRDGARVAATSAVRCAPESGAAWGALGDVAMDVGDLKTARDAYQRATQLEPGLVSSWSNLGVCLRRAHQDDLALRCFDRAVALEADAADLHSNRGNALAALGRFDEALVAHQRATALGPDSLSALGNLGNILRSLGRPTAAAACYERGLALSPGQPSLRWNRALAWLMAGEMARGFAEYEWRHQRPGRKRAPWWPERWRGSPGTRPLVLHTEQGFGDAIQFARFAPLVAQRRRGPVLLAVHPRLRALLQDLPGVLVVDRRQALPANAEHAYLMDVPGALGLGVDDLPGGSPYLACSTERGAALADRLGPPPDGGLLVGVGWQGNPEFEGDRLRSPPLAAFIPVLSLPSIRCVSLQKHHGLDQLAELPAGLAPEDLGAELDNGPDAFVDTAAAMCAVGAVLTSDTATAHLAGALGVPTCVVLPYAADWRWGVASEDTVWYPNMKLFRQPRPGDWHTPVVAAAAHLRRRLENR